MFTHLQVVAASNEHGEKMSDSLKSDQSNAQNTLLSRTTYTGKIIFSFFFFFSALYLHARPISIDVFFSIKVYKMMSATAPEPNKKKKIRRRRRRRKRENNYDEISLASLASLAL
jgi:hypothetical protein